MELVVQVGFVVRCVLVGICILGTSRTHSCTLPANSLANVVVICKGVFSSFSEFVWISGLPLFSTLQLSTSNF
ncbi:hypothetical protein D9758_006225 [Tetrapyrgos nigripes]|uniref:Uncharacterized protein n=1 Tax=Tetrapyrgos nigripes TaxID=182062 RepID=A0A8H5GB30_9AGAR|nr:hypothetical protein D9758_006225 [Tetrapyrgos nigripes]